MVPGVMNTIKPHNVVEVRAAEGSEEWQWHRIRSLVGKEPQRGRLELSPE